jgi:hypothetical protein
MPVVWRDSVKKLLNEAAQQGLGTPLVKWGLLQRRSPAGRSDWGEKECIQRTVLPRLVLPYAMIELAQSTKRVSGGFGHTVPARVMLPLNP